MSKEKEEVIDLCNDNENSTPKKGKKKDLETTKALTQTPKERKQILNNNIDKDTNDVNVAKDAVSSVKNKKNERKAKNEVISKNNTIENFFTKNNNSNKKEKKQNELSLNEEEEKSTSQIKLLRPVNDVPMLKSRELFKNIDPSLITSKYYFDSLSQYCKDLKFLNRKKYNEDRNLENVIEKQRKKKVIFIHDSFLSFKKIPDNESKIINPKNPLRKDEMLIDYDKDSEEELNEQIAEDIGSNEGSDEEDLVEEEEGQEKWLVPDGYLSQDERSDDDKNEDNYNTQATDKVKSIVELLELRKNYEKPIIITQFNDFKAKADVVIEIFTARIFPLANSNPNDCVCFPIQIKRKEERNTLGLKEEIFDKLTEIIEIVHGNYKNKDDLITMIHKRFPNINKSSLDNFFKNNTVKVPNNKGKKFWFVNQDLISLSKLSSDEQALILQKNEQEHIEYEAEKKLLKDQAKKDAEEKKTAMQQTGTIGIGGNVTDTKTDAEVPTNNINDTNSKMKSAKKSKKTNENSNKITEKSKKPNENSKKTNENPKKTKKVKEKSNSNGKNEPKSETPKKGPVQFDLLSLLNKDKNK